MKNLYESVMTSLEADKENYKRIFFDPIENQLMLVKSSYRLIPDNSMWWIYYDGQMWGQDIPESKTASWFYVGDL